MKTIKTVVCLIASFLTLAACQSGGVANSVLLDNLNLKYAEKITADHATLLEREYNHVAVDASVYKGLMEMLGVGERCIDFSGAMNPDVERLISSNADLLMLSAYEGADIDKYCQTGIPIVECTDFLEESPLGRAEWMRYFGRLWGVGEKADNLFATVEKKYLELKSETDDYRPRVFFDTMYGNQWYQPAEKSTMGILVADAGGALPFKTEQSGGSVPLSAEQVLMAAQDADVWIIRAMSTQPVTLETLAQMNDVYPQFKAYRTGSIYVCYTDEMPYYEETPFHPDYLLEDFIKILHPEFADSEKLHYFCRIK